MLSNFMHGWVDITIGKSKLCTASYLSDVPMNISNSMISYFSKENQLPYGINFDCEGSSAGIIEIDNDLYLWNDSIEPVKSLKKIDPEEFGLEKYACAKDIVKALSKEIMEDIKTNIDECINWALDEDSTKGDRWIRKTELKNAVHKLKYLLTV